MFISANAGLPLEEWTSITYHHTFDPMEVLKAGTNPALQFLGSFDVAITPRQTEDGEETITVTNRVSWTSYWRFLRYFGLPVPASWARNSFAMCGDMYTTLTWAESILPVTDPSEWQGKLNDSRPYAQLWRQFNMYPQEDFLPNIAYHPDIGFVAVDISRFYPNENYP